MRKLILALAVLIGAGAILPITYTVKEAKPASAATYCAPWQDFWCYQKYLRCGPWFWIGNIYTGYYLIDRCGNLAA